MLMRLLETLRRRLARDERGFTLIELVTAIAIGMVIVLAAFGLADASVRSFKKADDRVDVTQRGRLAMDQMTQRLRSLTCGVLANGNGTDPIAEATPTRISFWIDTTPTRTSAATSMNAGKKLVGYLFSGNNLYELSYAWNGTTPPTLASPVTQTLLLRNVIPWIDTSTAFKYYAYSPTYDSTAASGSAAAELFTPLAATVPSTSLDEIVRIEFSSKAYPLNGVSTSRNAVVFNNQFNSRTADSFEQSPPVC
jgi:Tfp pilus assembly protein PilW